MVIKKKFILALYHNSDFI